MIDIQNFIASHPFAASTIRTYTYLLGILLDETTPATLTAAELVNFVHRPNWSNARQCVALAAAQKYIRWAYGDTHPALSAKLKRIQGKPQRALDEKTTLLLLASFDRYTVKGARDLAICSLALDTGLRASELCRLQIADLNLTLCNLQVIVKGGHWAAAVFSPQTAAHLDHWLQYRPKTRSTTVFVNSMTGKTLSPEGLFNVVKYWGILLGIKLSPHDLRRTFACLSTQLMKAPERILMEGGRWQNTAMILRYTRTLKLESMRDYLPMLSLTKKTW